MYVYIYISNYKSWRFYGIHKQLGMIHGRVWKWRMNSLFIAVSVGNIVINHQIWGGVYPESSPAGSRSGSHDPELSSLRTVSTAPGGWDFSGSGENLRGSSLVSSTINRWLVRFPQTTQSAGAKTELVSDGIGSRMAWSYLHSDIFLGRIQISSDILTYTLYNYIYNYI